MASIIIFKPIQDVLKSTSDLSDLFDEVSKVLNKRSDLLDRYSRGITISSSIDATSNLQILLEKFIVDIATGYLSGEINYDVEVSSTVESNIKQKIFMIEPVTAQYADELRTILYTLAALNSDKTEEVNLFRQALLYGSCYERVIEDEENNLKYINLDAINTVAVYNNDVDPKLEAVISKFSYKEGTTENDYYRIYTAEDISVWKVDNKEKETDKAITGEDAVPHNWGKVPVNVYESDFSILDRCQSLIIAYEELLNNVFDTYQYNAEDCKMKIVGYRAQNPVMIPNPEYDPNDPAKANVAKMIINPLRQEEDEYILQGKTFYVEEGGDAGWLTKPVQSQDVTRMLDYYVNAIFQVCGIPNTADLSFTSNDLNASAIDRKFYIMNIALSDIRDGITKLITDRFKMILDRINLKFGTMYDIHNVTITIHSNLPSMEDENIDQMIRLDGLLSQETILEKLGYDYETEKARKLEEEDLYGINSDVDETEQTDEDDDGVSKEQEGTSSNTNTNTSKDDKVRHPILQYNVKPDGRTSH